jgi:hypothetical protein
MALGHDEMSAFFERHITTGPERKRLNEALAVVYKHDPEFSMLLRHQITKALHEARTEGWRLRARITGEPA